MLDNLPAELNQIILDAVEFPIVIKEAREARSRLMNKRKEGMRCRPELCIHPDTIFVMRALAFKFKYLYEPGRENLLFRCVLN